MTEDDGNPNRYRLNDPEQEMLTRYLSDAMGLEVDARWRESLALLRAVVAGCQGPNVSEHDPDAEDFPLEVQDERQTRGPLRVVYFRVLRDRRCVVLEAHRDGRILIGLQNAEMSPAPVRWVPALGYYIEDVDDGTPSGAVWAIVRDAIHILTSPG
jgi:hypothetical protein